MQPYQPPKLDWIPEAVRDMIARAYDQGKHDGLIEGYDRAVRDREAIEAKYKWTEDHAQK